MYLKKKKRKKKKLYASLTFKTLKIQLYDSSIDIIRKILSYFVTLFKKTEKFSPAKRTNIQHM